jgi:hypothetical protein
MLEGVDLSETALGDLLKPEQFKSELEAANFWNDLRTNLNIRDSEEKPEEEKGTTEEKTPEEKAAETRRSTINEAITNSGENKALSTKEYERLRQ